MDSATITVNGATTVDEAYTAARSKLRSYYNPSDFRITGTDARAVVTLGEQVVTWQVAVSAEASR